MKNKLKIMEKIAMIWTFPLIMLLFIGLALLALVLFIIVQFLNLSGTIGACLYIFDKTKLLITGRSLKKLIKEDEKKYKFES